MLTLLERLYIKEDMSREKLRRQYGILCGALGIFLNICLFICKLAAGLISNSVAITADSINNLSDAASSVVSLLGFKIAGQQPDKEHPYGHGRMEYVAGFIVSALILVMGWSLIKESVSKIIHPEDTIFSLLAVVILAASILVKCYMAYYNRRTGKKIDSVTLEATAIDSLSDCVSTSVILAVTLIQHFTGLRLDGYAGLLVGCLVAYAGFKAAADTLNPLLGQPPEKEFVERLTEIVENFDENIIGMHDLMVHDYGPGRCYVSVHAEVPREGDVLELHESIDALEKKLGDELNCYATVHMDPIVTKDKNYLRMKRRLNNLLDDYWLEIAEAHREKKREKNFNPEDFTITMHDFRMVPGENQTNLIFDIVVPLECPNTDRELKEVISTLVKVKMGTKYECVIEVDRDMMGGA